MTTEIETVRGEAIANLVLVRSVSTKSVANVDDLEPGDIVFGHSFFRPLHHACGAVISTSDDSAVVLWVTQPVDVFSKQEQKPIYVQTMGRRPMVRPGRLEFFEK